MLIERLAAIGMPDAEIIALRRPEASLRYGAVRRSEHIGARGSFQIDAEVGRGRR